MPEETLETVPEELSDVYGESDSNSAVDGFGESVDILGESGTDPADPETVPESVSETAAETEEFLEIDSANDVVVLSSPQSAKVDLGDSLASCYQLRISGTTYNAFFQTTDNLQVIDGKLINTGSSTIQALLSTSTTIDVDAWQQRYLSVLPLFGSSSNNSAYQYGSRCYITTYSASSSYNRLDSTTTYVQPDVLKEPKWGSDWSIPTVIIIFLLLVLVLFDMLGGIIRR